MAPLWIITCGQMIFGSEVSTGSYASIVLKLLFLIGPLTVGAIIQWWFSCSTEFFMQTLTWLLHMYINCVVICLIIVNFELFSPKFFKYSWKVMEICSFESFALNLIFFFLFSLVSFVRITFTFARIFLWLDCGFCIQTETRRPIRSCSCDRFKKYFDC